MVNRKIGYGIVQPGQSVPDGVPVIKVNNLISGLKSPSELDTTARENEAKYSRTRLRGGELIVSVVGTIGKTAIVPKSFAGCNLVRATALIDIEDELMSKWVKYYFDSPCGQSYIEQNLNTTVQPTLNIKSLVEMPIPIRNTTEMEKTVLLLSALDEKIEVNRQINDNLEQQAKALVRQYCKKITSSVELGTILSFENGFAFQSSSYHEKGKYRIITIKNVQDGRIDSQGASCIDDIPLRMKKGCILSIGDVLLSLTGNVGRVGIVCEDNLLLNQRVAKFVPNDIRILPLLYFYFRLSSTKKSLETISKGTAQQNLSPIEILKIEIPYEALQSLEFSNLLQPMFNTIYQKSIENIQLAEIRDSLLPHLISGELDASAVQL